MGDDVGRHVSEEGGAAAIMSFIRSAQFNGHDPYVYLKDVLDRLPAHRSGDIAELLPHRWAPAAV